MGVSIKAIILGVALHSGFSFGATEGNSKLSNVKEFLRENVINRVVLRSDQGTIADGKVAFEFKKKTTFANLVEGKTSLSFDSIVEIEQTNWDLGEDGEKILPGRASDRTLVLRYLLSKRESTGQIVGNNRIISSTKLQWVDSVSGIQVDYRGDKMIFKTTTNLYDDYFDAGGQFYPGASTSMVEYSVKDGLLNIRENLTAVYKVDPVTLEREFQYSRDNPNVEIEIKNLN